MSNKRVISIKLTDELRLRGMTQQQLADVTGIPQPTISRYAAGKVTPDHDNLDKIAKALKLSPADLLSSNAELEAMRSKLQQAKDELKEKEKLNPDLDKRLLQTITQIRNLDTVVSMAVFELKEINKQLKELTEKLNAGLVSEDEK